MELFIGIITLLYAHFMADFVFQTHKMATQKSDDVRVLTTHILMYAMIFFFAFTLVGYVFAEYYNIEFSKWLSMSFGITIINSIFHFMIDYFTSKATKYFWKKEDYHNFFVVIGFDQLLHVSLLIISYGQMVLDLKIV